MSRTQVPAVREVWATSMPGLAEQSELAASANAPKAWRFVTLPAVIDALMNPPLARQRS